MRSIAHIINPVKVNEKSDLFYAQPITFETILKAKSFCKFSDDISLFTTQYEEDKEIISREFTQLPNLSRSVLDVNDSLKYRKLPLIADILDRLAENTEAEYLLFTNMDIAVMPHFYDALFSYIEKGHDAVVINRRRLEKKYNSVDELPLMYADLGKSHPGFDCFLFKKELLSKFILSDICVGISFLEVTLVNNIFSFAENPLFVPDAHLTFHIGMDVLVPRNNLFYKHNKNTYFKKVQPQLKPHFSLKKFPYGTLPFPQRAIKWMLNPSLFTRNYLKLEQRQLHYRIKMWFDEIRWRILQR